MVHRLLILGLVALPLGCAHPSGTPSGDVYEVADGAGDVGPEWSWPWDAPAAEPQILLTVAQIPATMNGNIPYGSEDGPLPFMLHVNRVHFDLDVIADETAGPVDWRTLNVRCEVIRTDETGEEQRVPLSIEPGDFMAVEDPRASPHTRRMSVRAPSDWPDGEDVWCEAEATGPGATVTSGLTFHARSLDVGHDPFVNTDRWLVTLSRDMFTLEVTPDTDGSYMVNSTFAPDGDGVSDLDEALRALGLGSVEAPDLSASLKQTLLTRVRTLANALFGLDEAGRPTSHGANLVLYFEGDPDAPNLEDWPGEGDQRFSAIAIGGDAKVVEQDSGLVGKAKVDWSNQGVENDTVYGLGVFTSGIVRQVLGNPLGALLLEELLPDTGQPVGTHPADALLFGPEANPDPDTLGVDAAWRLELVTFAVDMLSAAIASTLAHEMGHSLGLVPKGPPPHGLFAGMKELGFTDNFVPDGHIDTPGLNTMQTGAVTNWVEALSDTPRFNHLNFAYLTRQLVITADW